MRIIDAHVHIASWPTIKKTEDYILSSMKKYGVSFSLISNCDGAEFPSVGKRLATPKDTLTCLKEVIAFVKKHPDETGALVWIRPRKEKLAQDLVDYIRSQRQYIYGIKFHPYESHLRIDTREMMPWINLARELGVPMLVHTAADKYSDVAFLKTVADFNPDVVFIAAHLQLCSDNKAAYEAMKTTPNLYADTAWVNMKMAKKVLEHIGEERIMFGTDNPIDGEDTLANPIYHDYFSNKLRLPAHLYHNLMARNAAKVYGIDLSKKR
jgi:uncharacterized protein